MIVNPQFFNYRLIIGSLIVAIAVLGVFSFNNYESLKTHQQFLEQEKKLVESELSQMISQYDVAIVNNKALSAKLIEAKNNTKLTLDSLQLLKSDVSVLSKFKQQVSYLKSETSQLFKTIDSFKLINKELTQSNLLAYNNLETQREANMALKSQNESLNATLKKGALLTANSFKAKAFRTQFGKIVETKKAASAESIQVCFTLAENALTEKGQKEIYIQIVNPKNNVVSDKGAIDFGDSSLIYSEKQLINYNNKVVDVCTSIKADPDDQPLTKGTYFVSIFHKDRKLGSTQIELN